MEHEATYVDCGCCGAYHRLDYYGDCRNDAERFDDIPDEARIADADEGCLG
jgi:hypothetical protein